MEKRSEWGALMDRGIQEPICILQKINHHHGNIGKTSYTLSTPDGHFINAKTKLGCILKAIIKKKI